MNLDLPNKSYTTRLLQSLLALLLIKNQTILSYLYTEIYSITLIIINIILK